MHRYIFHIGVLSLIVIVSAATFANQSAQAEPAAATQTENPLDAAARAWRERRLSYGKTVYQNFCASCHDGGIDGAPAIGDRDNWNKRSPLWLGVLFEHAKTGYIKMPPRGGSMELNDQSVDAAAEYMLSVTYPEWPLD